MSANDSEPEPTPVSDDLGETKPAQTHPVDFTDTVERLKNRASASRRASKGNKTNSTVVAFLAVSALLMVVVGAEDVVRRELVPDIADVAAQRLEAAHERVRIATEDATQKSTAAVTKKAVADSIKGEELAAQKATKDAEALAAVRADAFVAHADSLAALANAEATAVAKADALAAAETRRNGDIKSFALAEEDLAAVKTNFASFSQEASLAQSDYGRAKQQVLETAMKLKNSRKLSPETVEELGIELARAQAQRDELESRLDYLRSIGQDFKVKRIRADNVYDRALAAAEKAKAKVNTAGQDLRAADVDVAKAQEAATRAKATLSDADDKATAAQGFAKELNAPDAIRKRNERYAMALAEADVASNNAIAAQETASLATQTAKELAAVASVAPLRQVQETDVQQAITRGGAVAGAIGIAILVLQIFVNSMRYYARLAEFYDAQADALLASGNNPALAGEFLEKFSPASIDFGKVPVSLYEKALDTVGKAAGGAAGRGKI